jgi:hypothetical protein
VDAVVYVDELDCCSGRIGHCQQIPGRLCVTCASAPVPFQAAGLAYQTKLWQANPRAEGRHAGKMRATGKCCIHKWPGKKGLQGQNRFARYEGQ